MWNVCKNIGRRCKNLAKFKNIQHWKSFLWAHILLAALGKYVFAHTHWTLKRRRALLTRTSACSHRQVRSAIFFPSACNPSDSLCPSTIHFPPLSYHHHQPHTSSNTTKLLLHYSPPPPPPPSPSPLCRPLATTTTLPATRRRHSVSYHVRIGVHPAFLSIECSRVRLIFVDQSRMIFDRQRQRRVTHPMEFQNVSLFIRFFSALSGVVTTLFALVYVSLSLDHRCNKSDTMLLGYTIQATIPSTY